MKNRPSTRPARFRRTGFSLIELLLVISIILILSAIAVVNFAEAQIRSKVSRAKADMRSITVGIEAYAVDHNDYPLNPGAPDPNAADMATRPPLTGYNVTPWRITTPVAYMSSRPLDPFKPAGSDLYGFRLGAYPDELVYYDYYTIIPLGQWHHDCVTPGGEVRRCVSLIAVDYPRPHDTDGADPEADLMNHGAYRKYGRWLQWSPGPDLALWRAHVDFVNPGFPLRALNDPPHPPLGYTFDIPYDPTNGSVSFGNIIRTQLGDLGLNPATGEPTFPPAPPPPGPAPGRGASSSDPAGESGGAFAAAAAPGQGTIPARHGESLENRQLAQAAVPAGASSAPPASTGTAPAANAAAGSPDAPAAGASAGGDPADRVRAAIGLDPAVGAAIPAGLASPPPGGASAAPGAPGLPPEAAAPAGTPEGVATPPESRGMLPPEVTDLRKFREFIDRQPGRNAPQPSRGLSMGPIDPRKLGWTIMFAGFGLLGVYLFLRAEKGRLEGQGAGGAAITDDALLKVKNLERVRALNLAGSKVTARGIERLRGLPLLQTLNLWQTAADDEAVRILEGLPALRKLILMDTAVTGACAASLRSLPALEELVLAGCDVGDDAVENLAALKGLKVLNVRGTRVSAEGAARLREALARCKVIHHAAEAPAGK